MNYERNIRKLSMFDDVAQGGLTGWWWVVAGQWDDN